MSYILEALKKSEQERRRSQVPDWQTQHTPPPERRRGKRLWPVLIVAALLLNAAILTLYLRPWNASEPVASEIEPPQTIVAATISEPASEPAAEAPHPPAPSVGLERVDQSSPVPLGTAPFAEPAPPPVSRAVSDQAPSVPRIEDLPLSLRRQLPEIVISLHFYTDSPAARMVRINGRNLRENQRVDENTIVREITEEGVVLDFNGQSFAVRNF